jgi:hypothetical protein
MASAWAGWWCSDPARVGGSRRRRSARGRRARWGVGQRDTLGDTGVGNWIGQGLRAGFVATGQAGQCPPSPPGRAGRLCARPTEPDELGPQRLGHARGGGIRVHHSRTSRPRSPTTAGRPWPRPARACRRRPGARSRRSRRSRRRRRRVAAVTQAPFTASGLWRAGTVLKNASNRGTAQSSSRRCPTAGRKTARVPMGSGGRAIHPPAA